MASSLFGPGRPTVNRAQDIADAQAKAMREDADRYRAARAAGPDRRSIAASTRDDTDEM